MANQMGLPFNHRRFIHVHINGVGQTGRSNDWIPANAGRIYEDTQRPESGFIESWFPTDANGQLFKAAVWGEEPADLNYKNATLQNFTTTGGAKKQERYRWNWLKRAVKDSAHNFVSLFALVDAANAQSDYTSQVDGLVDTEQWMRILAWERFVGNWDSYGWYNGQNMYAYKPSNNKWQLLPWDIDVQFGDLIQGTAGTYNDDLFSYVGSSEPVLYLMMTHPPFQRAYWRGLEEGANGPMLSTKVEPTMDALNAALVANGVTPVGTTTSAKAWIANRRGFILTEVAARNALFEITSNSGNNFTTSQNPYPLTGNAPVSAVTIKVNGTAYTATWDFLDPNATPKKPVNWTISVPLNAGANVLSVQAFDRYGNLVASDSITITRSP